MDFLNVSDTAYVQSIITHPYCAHQTQGVEKMLLGVEYL